LRNTLVFQLTITLRRTVCEHTRKSIRR